MANPIKALKAVKKITGGKKGRAVENKVRKEFGMSKSTNTAGMRRAIKLIDKKLMGDPVPPKRLKKYSGSSNKSLSKKLNKDWNTEYPKRNKEIKIIQKQKSIVTKSKNKNNPDYLMGSKTVPTKKRSK